MALVYYKERSSGDFVTIANWDFNDDPVYAESSDPGNTSNWGLNHNWRDIADAVTEIHIGLALLELAAEPSGAGEPLQNREGIWLSDDGYIHYKSTSGDKKLATLDDITGLDFQDSVLDKDLTAPPGAPSTGDRYIVAAGATGAWAGHDDDIAEWNGASWDFYTPNDGWVTFIEDEDKFYHFNSGAWGVFGSLISHNNLSGLQGGTANEYYHFTASEHTELTNWLDNVVLSTDGTIATDGDIKLKDDKIIWLDTAATTYGIKYDSGQTRLQFIGDAYFDSNCQFRDSSGLETDVINEFQTGQGVTIEGIIHKDNAVYFGDDEKAYFGDSGEVYMQWNSGGWGEIVTDEDGGFFVMDSTWSRFIGIQNNNKTAWMGSGSAVVITYENDVQIGSPFTNGDVNIFMLDDPAIENWTASQSGTTITKTAGRDFTANDVGMLIFWDLGATLEKAYYVVTAFISATQVTVDTSNTVSSRTLYGAKPLFFADGGIGKIGIGLYNPNEKLTVNGILSLAEGTAPGNTSGFGKVYVKSSDSRLYYQNDSGDEYDLLAGCIHGSFTATGVPYRLTQSTSYAGTGLIGQLIFNGTDVFGVPSKIYIVGSIDSATGTYSIRVRDISNGTTICEQTGLTNTTAAIIDMGTLSNLPASQAIFEVQALVSNAARTAYISSIKVDN